MEGGSVRARKIGEHVHIQYYMSHKLIFDEKIKGDVDDTIVMLENRLKNAIYHAIRDFLIPEGNTVK
jgi:hypothetical protein